ncbi:MAG: hypothetical protein Q4B18_02870 [Bacillota bacterium]|nr:hypothetical protein [Bacillota bacterium]
MKKLNIALLGFGSAGQAFAKILLEKKEQIEKEYDTSVNVVAITTKTRGNLVDAWGIDLERVLNNIQETGVFPKSQETMLQRNALDVAETVEYDVLVEMTPLEFADSHIATDHVMTALKRGKHVICANKGPIAWHYKELKELAEEKGSKFLFEAILMDGTPVFKIVRENLPLCKVTEVKGILNSTTNYVLKGLRDGKEMKEVIAELKKRGVIEANPNNDLEGKEAAVKIAIVANAMMGANLTPKDIDITGIENITKKDIDEALERGNVIKLMCSAYEEDGVVKAKVAPEEIDRFDVFADVNGTSTAISITTDLMGTMMIIEDSPSIVQAGYGIFSDLMTIIKDM